MRGRNLMGLLWLLIIAQFAVDGLRLHKNEFFSGEAHFICTRAALTPHKNEREREKDEQVERRCFQRRFLALLCARRSVWKADFIIFIFFGSCFVQHFIISLSLRLVCCRFYV
jgi:hypothetical protein